MMQWFESDRFEGRRARGQLSIYLGVLLGLFILVLQGSAYGQSQNAGIVSGRVTDSAGAAVAHGAANGSDRTTIGGDRARF